VSDHILASVRSPFRALAAVFVPETSDLDEPAWGRLESIVRGALATRPPALQRQVVLFMRILDLLALVRHRGRLAALDPATRTRLVERVGASRLLLLRRGVWGLRTLVQMGWYGQPEVQRSLGYRASPAGWAARR